MSKDEQRILDRVREYAALPLLDRTIRGVVRLEDYEDKPFWSQHFVNYPCRFVSGTRGSANHPTGCDECLKYLPYLSQRLMIAVDSDVRWLNSSFNCKYVFETYTYSWENHLCEANALQARFQEKCPLRASTFDFRVFLDHLSALIYPALALLCEDTPAITIKDLAKAIRLPKNICVTTENNGKEIIDYIRQNVQALIASHTASAAAVQRLMAHRVTPQNAYLHVRGHELYSLVTRVGSLHCKNSGINFAQAVLHVNHYTIPSPVPFWQETKIQNKIQQLL